jgi:alkylation response protein AidB-like acyl-CoA dehydrogenase
MRGAERNDDALGAAALAAARALAPRLRAAADDAERDRRLPPALVRDLVAAGLFQLCVPRALGGAEAEPSVLLGALEALAEADGAAGWCAMIGATTGLVAGWLPEAAAREIYGRGPVVTGGVFAPQGRALVAGGGYRVSGRWAFASGCEHCDWLMGGCVVVEGGAPRRLADGGPETRLVMFPAGAARVLDTWTVSGLRGTGSHDIAVDDLEVPAERSCSLVTGAPRERGPLYAFPPFGLFAASIAAVALGIARHALDALAALAVEKTPTLGRRALRERPVTQAQVAEAEGTLGAARAFLAERVDAAWQPARAGEAVPLEIRARLRLAATGAVAAAARATDVAYQAGGGSAIYASSPLQRCFRDVHAVTQHMLVAAPVYELVGRVLLGVETDTSML